MMYFGFEHITIEYGKKTILRDLSFDIPKNKIVSLIGPNGCGKSSLLKTVSRAVTPKTGHPVYNNKPVSKYPPKQTAQKIAYLAQVHTSPPDIDVNTLVSYGRYPYMKFGRGLTAEDKKIVNDAIYMTGLTNLQFQSLDTLSGGERQRAWIAMTVAQQPEILILDEPTTYLDIGFQVEVLELVRKLNREMGITILMVLHDLNLAARYSDSLYAIKDGKVYAGGTPAEVLTTDHLQTIFGIDAQIIFDSINNCPFFIPNKSINNK